MLDLLMITTSLPGFIFCAINLKCFNAFAIFSNLWKDNLIEKSQLLKALVWFWLIDETLSANLVYQSDYEIGSTTPSDEAMAKIMMMVMAW